jgi:hypothetical protein
MELLPAMTEIARKFFDACERGKGWAVCKAYCTPNATFAAQAEPLADVGTLRQYADWMKSMLTVIPDGRYEVRSFATDENGKNVSAYGGSRSGRRRNLLAPSRRGGGWPYWPARPS